MVVLLDVISDGLCFVWSHVRFLVVVSLTTISLYGGGTLGGSIVRRRCELCMCLFPLYLRVCTCWGCSSSQNGTISRESSDHLFRMQGCRAPVFSKSTVRSLYVRTMLSRQLLQLSETPLPQGSQSISMQIRSGSCGFTAIDAWHLLKLCNSDEERY